MLQRIPLPYELSGDFVSVKLGHMLMPQTLASTYNGPLSLQGRPRLKYSFGSSRIFVRLYIVYAKTIRKQAIVSVEITHIQNALQEVLWWQDE